MTARGHGSPGRIPMKTSFRLVLTVLACLAAPALARAEEPKTAKVAYSALEIARFDVNREDYSSKEAERAEAGSPVLILGGRIVDFKPGNRAARYFAGFGAGQQKIEVECVLKNKTTGEVVAKEVTSIGRSPGGLRFRREGSGLFEALHRRSLTASPF